LKQNQLISLRSKKQNMKNNRQAGFSLIELLIVVAIIGIIAAIAIPNLLASRRAANEGSAQSSLRTVHSAEATYQATSGQGNFGTLPQLAAGNLVDPVLGSLQKSGYNFLVTPVDLVPGTSPATFVATGIPMVATGIPATGTRKFCVTESGVMAGMTGGLTTPMTRAECDAAANALGNN
jgi:type IV pilus assembly protein PilA